MTIRRVLIAFMAMFALLTVPAHADAAATVKPATYEVLAVDLCDTLSDTKSDAGGKSHHHGCTASGIAETAFEASAPAVSREAPVAGETTSLATRHGAPPYHPPLA